MLAHLMDVSIRSLLLGFAAFVVWCFPKARRSAAFEHALWTSVGCGMLALFIFGGALPKLPLRVLSNDDVQVVRTSIAPADIAIERNTAINAIPGPAIQSTARPIDWTFVALMVWAGVAGILLVRLMIGMMLACRLMKNSTADDGFSESPLVNVPVTIGWFRPRILLPLSWREWSPAKLTAVLEHEGAHVRRRDGLAQLLAAVNRCIFWFHPLAWFLERQLGPLAEQACDEACVAKMADPEWYAHLLVEMASVMDGSQNRFRYQGLTMAAAVHLRKRIESIMAERRTFSTGLSRTVWIAIAVCTVPLVFGAGVVEVKRQPPVMQMELPKWNAPAMPLLESPRRAPVLIAQVQQPAATPVVNASFDSASIQNCEQGQGAGRGGRGGAGGRGYQFDPGVFFVHCMSVSEMVNFVLAHGAIAPLVNDGQEPMEKNRIRSGISWTLTDYYTIDARTNDPIANSLTRGPGMGQSSAAKLMAGPMLLQLLQDRFHLKFHSVTETVPMYELTVASSGLKLKPFEKGNCVDFITPPSGLGLIFPFPEGYKFGRDPKPPCNWIGWDVNGPNQTLEGGSTTMQRIADALGDFIMDHHVLNHTGVDGEFNLHLEYLPDEHAAFRLADPKMTVDPQSSIPRAPAIFTAIEQQSGLELKQMTGPKGYIEIDSAERPALN